MVEVDATAAVAQVLYEAMSERLVTIRARLGRPLTLSEKILLGHALRPGTQELEPGHSYLSLRPDRVVLQDVLGQTAFLQFMQTNRESVALPVTVHCDHLIRARSGSTEDLKTSIADNAEIYDFLKSAAQRYGAGFWEPGAGIIHQVVLEQYAFPGQLIMGTDSHTPNAGGLGACAIGVGGADAVEAMAGMPFELLYPKRIAVYLTGRLNGWAAPKDVILHVLGELGVSGATNAIVEYIGPGARTISATGKATICNMGAEMGATTSLFASDASMYTYLRATGRGELADAAARHEALLSPDDEAQHDPESHYDRVLRIDLSQLEPYVSGPDSPDRARPLSRFIAELDSDKAALPRAASAVLLGSCTNSSYEDMCRAADVASQAFDRGVSASVPLLITPGSERIRGTIRANRQLDALEAIGGRVLANACGPCIGQWDRADTTDGAANFIVTTFNRNFRARNDGRGETMNLIVSPELATALAIAGRVDFNPLTDRLTAPDGSSFRLRPPAPAPEVPPQGFAPPGVYHAPGGPSLEIRIAPTSLRLQKLSPWPKRQTADMENVAVLVKVAGKTTTDHISPAGKWLSLRGHLERFSENFLMGGVNAWTGERGLTRDPDAPDRSVSIAAAACACKSRGIRWAIVGDWNYGEGSSREHAALSPRLLGGAIVVARSFARIHETNLKKQGLLALTFADPADYDRVREGDRIDIEGASPLRPGEPVRCRLSHDDGTAELVELRHTYSAEQLRWYRAGSALNAAAAEGVTA